MKAIVAHEWGGPEVLQLEEVADPVPGAGEVLVRLMAIGVNPYETYMRSGVYAHLPALPAILGSDAAGEVAAVGPGASRFSVGDRVYISGSVGGFMTGCYAEFAVRPEVDLMALPANVSFQAGAAVGVPYATAYYSLFNRGRARPGETVFVHGASGAVGTAALQLARAHGMTVIGSAGSARGLDLVAAQGAHHVVDHTRDGYLEEVRAKTGGDGPDLILEMLANVNLENDMALAARYGRIVIIGNRGSIEVTPRQAMMKELDLIGIALWNCPPDQLRSLHRGLVAGLENGSLNPVIGREMPLAETAQAHVAVLEPGAYGKIVLRP